MVRFAFCLLGSLTLLVSCGGDPQTAYSAENGDNFYAACTIPLEDSILQARMCQCVFERLRDDVPYLRFEDIDERLADDPLAGLPPEVTKVIADCVIEEVGL